MKAGTGADLLIQGSGSLYPQLWAGPIDRFTLMTFPITLGRGGACLENGMPAKGLRLVAQEVFASGVIVAVDELRERSRCAPSPKNRQARQSLTAGRAGAREGKPWTSN